MRTAMLLLTVLGLLTACGVTTQDEPAPLIASTSNPVPTPTLTQRPDPAPSSSPTTSATTPTTAVTSPTTGSAR